MRVISQITWIRNAEYALKEAIKTYAIITAAIFRPKEPSEDLATKYRVVKERRKNRELKAIKLSLVILGTGLALSFIADVIVNATIVITFGGNNLRDYH